jgi:hypothetical protein
MKQSGRIYFKMITYKIMDKIAIETGININEIKKLF